tara:strand:+ start:72 stop:488 length:417 start_codon:yes stop_codon:yes gene_type:complete
MTDHLNPEKRSWNMSRIRSKDTSPELKVRKYLYAKGIRYRLHRKDLPGKPDITISRIKTAIFIHGCFWHQHENCKKANIPKTRTTFWLSKLNNNKERDIINFNLLTEMNWNPIIIWECTLNELEQLTSIHQITGAYEE